MTTDAATVDYAVRQLHARFVDAVWRKDASGFAAGFAEDGVWKIAGMELTGRADIAATIAKFLGACERVWMSVGLTVLDLGREGEGTATGRTPVTEYTKLADGSFVMTLGIYFDRMVERDGQWLFAHRHYSLQYRGPADLSAPFVESPDYGPPPAMPPLDAPTLTRRAAD